MARSVASRPLREFNVEPAEPTLKRVVWLLAQLMKVLTRQDWAGQQNIPATGGAVVVVNHISNFDPISVGHFLAYAGRWPRYLGKASVFRVPIIGKLITACGQIPVERNSADARKALDRAIAAVRDGKCITIFPEGTITKDPDLWPMVGRTGAARIALETGCPVIPVGQWGSQQIMYASTRKFPRFLPRKTMIVRAGSPVELDDLRQRPVTTAVLREATSRIMAAITDLVAEIRDQVPLGPPLDPRLQATEELKPGGDPDTIPGNNEEGSDG